MVTKEKIGRKRYQDGVKRLDKRKRKIISYDKILTVDGFAHATSTKSGTLSREITLTY